MISNYNLVKAVKYDIQANAINSPEELRAFVRSLNPHEGIRYRRIAVLIAYIGISEYEGNEYFNMPATSDLLWILRNDRHLINRLDRKAVGA